MEQEWEVTPKEREEASSEYNDLVKKFDALQEEQTSEERHTEALVNQQNNMNTIIKNGQAETKEPKERTKELCAVHRGYINLDQDFHLENNFTKLSAP